MMHDHDASHRSEATVSTSTKVKRELVDEIITHDHSFLFVTLSLRVALLATIARKPLNQPGTTAIHIATTTAQKLAIAGAVTECTVTKAVEEELDTRVSGQRVLRKYFSICFKVTGLK